ncbi:MAG: hypothetical protein IJ729_02330, partial [Alloprevotella sp.]|nr:hypothetical protein [Alloprevotella sp.]
MDMYGLAFLFLFFIVAGVAAWYSRLLLADGEGQDAMGRLYYREKEAKEMKSEKENGGTPQTKEFV